MKEITEERIKEIQNIISILHITLRDEVLDFISPEIDSMINNHNDNVTVFLHDSIINTIIRLLISKGIMSSEEFNGALYAKFNNEEESLNTLKEERDMLLQLIGEDYMNNKDSIIKELQDKLDTSNVNIKNSGGWDK